MGCFNSSFHRSQEGPLETENQEQLREREREHLSNDHPNQTSNSVDDFNDLESTYTYRPDTNDYVLDHIYSDRSNKMGLELKLIHFKWTSKTKMTKTEIESKRKLFWDTCDTFGGQKQIWEALRSICSDPKKDLDFANVILESCGVILPLGLLNEIYDSTGFRYNLPAYCVCDPVDLLYNNNIEDEGEGVVATSGSSVHINTYNNNNIHTDKPNQQIKIRLSHGKDVIISLAGHIKIADLKSSVKESEQLQEKQRMVMIWCGKVLEDKVLIESLNLPRGAVLQLMLP